MGLPKVGHESLAGVRQGTDQPTFGAGTDLGQAIIGNAQLGAETID
jgi:hypothetical protein